MDDKRRRKVVHLLWWDGGEEYELLGVFRAEPDLRKQLRYLREWVRDRGDHHFIGQYRRNYSMSTDSVFHSLSVERSFLDD